MIGHTLQAAKEKQRVCEEKRWRFIIAGRTIILKEVADKVVHWLSQFTEVGDAVANVDPIHVGLPWAGIRLLLQVARPRYERSNVKLIF